MAKRGVIWLAGVLAPALVACATAASEAAAPSDLIVAPAPGDLPPILDEAPERDFTPLSDVVVEMRVVRPTEIQSVDAKLRLALRTKAAQAGADAVVGVSFLERRDGTREVRLTTGTLLRPMVRRIARGIMIQYEHPGATK